MEDLASLSRSSAAPPVAVPAGYTGPVALPGTNRHVYWTGRVAIGLRYEKRAQYGPTSQSAIWVQNLMLAQRPVS
jgi:hypothetical protein